MAKTAAEPPGRSGSQFFVVTAPADAGLPPEYALLGKVSEGDDVVEAIGELGDPAPSSRSRPSRSKGHDRGRVSGALSSRMAKVEVGDTAPDFELPGTGGSDLPARRLSRALASSSPSIRATSRRSARASSAPTATRPTASTSSTPRCSGSRRSRSTRTSASQPSTGSTCRCSPIPTHDDRAGLRRARARRAGAALDLRRRPGGDRPLPPRRPARPPLQGRRATSARRCARAPPTPALG